MNSMKSALDVGRSANARSLTMSSVVPSRSEAEYRPKRAMDILLAMLMLLAAAPVMLIFAVLIRLDGGPAFYGHVRIGRHGREFSCMKFRSMVTNGDEVLGRHLAANPAARIEWEVSRKLRNDPRVTWLGRFLRATSLDELPQLFNVLNGDMSLVGPRPVVMVELERHYGPEAQDAYLSVRPGVTGLWQVSGRSDVSYDQRVALDTEYVRNASFGTDLTILWRTVGVVLIGRGAR